MKYPTILLLWASLLFVFPSSTNGQTVISNNEMVIRNIIKTSSDHYLKDCKIGKSAFYILDVQLDAHDSSDAMVSVFTKIESEGICVIDSILLQLSTLNWKPFCSDRIIIPIYLLPLTDDSIVHEKPIILGTGHVYDKANNYRQYIFKTIVLTINDTVK
jgi:hypothetical protein